MKPLWCVTITTDIIMPVVAGTQEEAEDIAKDFMAGGDFNLLDADLSAEATRLSSLKFAPFFSNDLPLGTEDDPELEPLTAKEYLDKYTEWKKEEDMKKELEERQGKLF